MKFTADRVNLISVLEDAGKAVSNKPVMPVLGMIKIKADNDVIEVTGSDSDMTIMKKLNEDIEINENGEYAISKKIVDILKGMNSQNVTVECVGRQAVIKCGRSKYKLGAIEGNSYPRISYDVSKTFKVKADDFKKAIENTIQSVSDKDSRMMLTGINISFNENATDFVACDGYRMSEVSYEAEGNETVNALVPGKSLKRFVPYITGDEIEIGIAEGKKIVIKTEETVMMSRLLEFTYPDVSKIKSVLNNKNAVLKTDRDELINILRRMKYVIDNDEIVTLDMKNDGIVLSGADETDSAIEEISGIKKGEDLRISFNADYLIQALKTFDSNIVEIIFSGKLKPFGIVEENDDGFKNMQIILPVRTH